MTVSVPLGLEAYFLWLQVFVLLGLTSLTGQECLTQNQQKSSIYDLKYFGDERRFSSFSRILLWAAAAAEHHYTLILAIQKPEALLASRSGLGVKAHPREARHSVW